MGLLPRKTGILIAGLVALIVATAAGCNAKEKSGMSLLAYRELQPTQHGFPQ